MNLRKIAAAGLTSALLVGLLGIGGTPAVADDTYATVSGKITLDGKPAKGPSVSIRNAKTYAASAATAASGAYWAAWVEPGTYSVVVDTYGYDPVTYDSVDHPFLETYSGNTVREPDAKYYTVTAGSSLTVDVKLDAVGAHELAAVEVVEADREAVGPDGGVVGVRALQHRETREGAVGIHLE